MANDILMIDDDQSLTNIVEMYLIDKGFIFRKLHRGRLLEEELGKKLPDLIILDIELLDMDGFDLCNIIHTYQENLPIIFLSNHHEESNRIRAFQSGGDDFIGKPFSLEELYLRILARLKDKQVLQGQTKFRFGQVTLDVGESKLIIQDQNIILTATEIEIIRLLASHPNHIFSEKDIYTSIWADDYSKDTRMVNVHISNLRKKIEKVDAEHRYIQTIWGKGYKYIG